MDYFSSFLPAAFSSQSQLFMFFLPNARQSLHHVFIELSTCCCCVGSFPLNCSCPFLPRVFISTLVPFYLQLSHSHLRSHLHRNACVQKNICPLFPFLVNRLILLQHRFAFHFCLYTSSSLSNITNHSCLSQSLRFRYLSLLRVVMLPVFTLSVCGRCCHLSVNLLPS